MGRAGQAEAAASAGIGDVGRGGEVREAAGARVEDGDGGAEEEAAAARVHKPLNNTANRRQGACV